jgi:hypothetical protein
MRIEMSPDSRSADDLTRAMAEEEAGKAANAEGFKRLQELLQEDTVQGALRRALEGVEGSHFEVTKAAAIETGRLKDFYWGDADLLGEEIDRLARVLHLQLVSTAV